MHATEAARLAAASASSLPAIPTWLGIQQKLTVFPARFKDIRSDKISCTRGFVGLKALIAKRLLMMMMIWALGRVDGKSHFAPITMSASRLKQWIGNTI